MSQAPRSDRAFGLLLIASAPAIVVLLLPIVITVAPGAAQSALHVLEGAFSFCARAIRHVHWELPSLGAVVLGLTAAAFAAALGRIIRSVISVVRVAHARIEVRTPLRLAGAAQRLDMLEAVVCCIDPRPYAYCAGLLAPRIYVSTGAVAVLGDAELEAVLLHERHHRLRRDPLRVLVGRAAASFLFALPLVAELQHRFEVAKELDADRAAVSAQHGRPAALAGALLALGDGMVPFRAGDVAASAWHLTRVRIDQLIDPAGTHVPGPSYRAIALSGATLVLAAGLALGQATRAHLDPAGGLPEAAPAAHQCAVLHDRPQL